MIGAIRQINRHIYNRKTQRSFSKIFNRAVLNRWNILLGHHAADNTVDEFVGAAARVGFDAQLDVAVLAVAAGLFLVFSLGFGLALDCFFEGDLRGLGLALDAVFAFHATPLRAAEDDANAREQFLEVLNAINNNSFEQIKDSIDKADLTNRVINIRPLEEDTRIWFNANFWEVIEPKFRGLMPEQNEMKKMELVDFRFENRKGSAVLRYRRPNYSYFYQRIELRQNSRSQLKIVDVQRFNLRQSLVGEVGEYLVTRMPSRMATRNLLTKQDPTDEDVFQFTELLKAYRDRETDRFFQIYDQMDASLKGDLLLAKFAVLTAYYGKDEKRMIGIFPEFFDMFKDDPKAAVKEVARLLREEAKVI